MAIHLKFLLDCRARQAGLAMTNSEFISEEQSPFDKLRALTVSLGDAAIICVWVRINDDQRTPYATRASRPQQNTERCRQDLTSEPRRCVCLESVKTSEDQRSNRLRGDAIVGESNRAVRAGDGGAVSLAARFTSRLFTPH